jgi:Secretion system C-terminal sorting domain
MKVALIQLLLSGIYHFACAQTIAPLWVRHDIANGSTLYGTPFVLIDSFHNTIVCGSDYHPGPLLSFLTTKYDSNGTLIWKRTFDLIANDDIISATTDETGSIYVGGNTSLNSINGTLPRFIVIKYAANGDSLWNYRFDGPTVGVNYITKVLLDSEQNLMVFGQYGDTVALRGGLFVTKVSPDGQELWRATYLDPVYGFGGLDVRWINDRWVFWGRNYTTSEGYRFLAWQLDNSGVSLGTPISALDPNDFNTQYIDKHGSLFVGADRKYRIVKYAISGQTEWVYEKSLVPSSATVPARMHCIEANNESEVYVSGHIKVDSIGLQPVTSKLSSTGNLLWEHSVNFNGIKSGYPLKNYWINPNQLLVAGNIYFNFNSNYYEFYVAVYDDNGFIKGGITDLEGDHNLPTSIAPDGASVYVAGYAFPTIFTNPSKQILCKYALSDLVSTHTAPPNIGHLRIWPNPSTDWVRIQMPEITTMKGQRNLELTDMAGKLLRSQQIAVQDQFFDLSLEGLPAGTYFLIFKHNGLPTHIEQLVKP